MRNTAMNQTTQTQISYKKKYRFATKKKSDMQKAKKTQICIPKKKKKKNSNLHDTGEDLQKFCMTGPSSRDLYKTNPDLQGLEKKKKKKSRSANTNCNLQWRDTDFCNSDRAYR